MRYLHLCHSYIYQAAAFLYSSSVLSPSRAIKSRYTEEKVTNAKYRLAFSEIVLFEDSYGLVHFRRKNFSPKTNFAEENFHPYPHPLFTKFFR
jgi:hypothetical protein